MWRRKKVTSTHVSFTHVDIISPEQQQKNVHMFHLSLLSKSSIGHVATSTHLPYYWWPPVKQYVLLSAVQMWRRTEGDSKTFILPTGGHQLINTKVKQKSCPTILCWLNIAMDRR